MSRGPGNLQRLLLAIISQQAKPMTMAEIVAFLMQLTGVNDPDRKVHPTVLRKLYRSLKALCDVDLVVALGDGGPGNAKRYCFNPHSTYSSSKLLFSSLGSCLARRGFQQE
jgi:hypothetical protein